MANAAVQHGRRQRLAGRTERNQQGQEVFGRRMRAPGMRCTLQSMDQAVAVAGLHALPDPQGELTRVRRLAAGADAKLVEVVREAA